MKIRLRPFIYSLALTLALVRMTSAAELLTNGNFTTVGYSPTYTGTLPKSSTIFGQFGTGTGSNLTVSGWSTTGYNFLFASGTADSGTKATGANPAVGTTPAAPNEAPGQYNAPNGYGSTYLWGTGNGGLNAIPASPDGGNYVAADGAFQVGAISQTVNTLTSGQQYAVSFFWAAAQQQSYDGDTTDNWQVSLGGQSFTTSTVTVPSHGFSGWMQQTFIFTATASSETLSFLANGLPMGEPPFALLDGVSLTAVPEPSAWMAFVGLGAVCTVIGVIRRRRQAAVLAGGANE